ncbi:hypothetical protein GOP47_0028613 [Adiantum capillus-veneris]|nr:hypothetical protein GOP47_0028613 [Adiantum capillus-veneris]
MDTSMDELELKLFLCLDVAAHEIPFSPILDFDPTPPTLASKALDSGAIANLSPSPRLQSRSLGSSPISKKLSPKGGVKKASMSLKKAFQIARGKPSRSLADTAFSSPLVKDDDLKEDLNLAIMPTLRLLTISELSETTNFRFALEGEVLNKYGTYKVPKSNFGRYLRADLLDRESRHTVTFVVTEIYLSDFVEAFAVNDYVEIEGAEPFDCCLQLYPEQKIKDLLSQDAIGNEFVSRIVFIVVKVENTIKSDGTPSYRLTVADGPSTSDRASLLFVPTRRVDYQLMVHEVKAKGFYTCVARNINIFKQLSNTLSVVDATILCSLPDSLSNLFQEYLHKQVSNLGFGKKVFGTLEIASVNSLDVEYSCGLCKGTNVSRQAINPFCCTCGMKTQIVKSPLLPARIYPQDGVVVAVILQGAIVDSILGFSQPFLHYFEHNLVELKSSLLNFKKAGWFTIDKGGFVVAFKEERNLALSPFCSSYNYGFAIVCGWPTYV